MACKDGSLPGVVAALDRKPSAVVSILTRVSVSILADRRLTRVRRGSRAALLNHETTPRKTRDASRAGSCSPDRCRTWFAVVACSRCQMAVQDAAGQRAWTACANVWDHPCELPSVQGSTADAEHAGVWVLSRFLAIICARCLYLCKIEKFRNSMGSVMGQALPCALPNVAGCGRDPVASAQDPGPRRE